MPAGVPRDIPPTGQILAVEQRDPARLFGRQLLNLDGAELDDRLRRPDLEGQAATAVTAVRVLRLRDGDAVDLRGHAVAPGDDVEPKPAPAQRLRTGLGG